MAYNDSGEISVSQSTHNLGGYTFELKVQTVHEPGEEEVVSVFAICRGPDGNRETQVVDFPVGTEVESWSVEANETEATVYVVVNIPEVDWHQHTSELNTSPLLKPITSGAIHVIRKYSGLGGKTYTNIIDFGGNGICYGAFGGQNFTYLIAMSKPITVTSSRVFFNDKGEVIQHRSDLHNLNESFTYNSKTVYYVQGVDAFSAAENTVLFPRTNADFYSSVHIGEIAWTIVYGTVVNPEYAQKEQLVGRFAIDLREAAGGPDSDWDEPGDTGDPEKTLYVGVVGATAGQPGGRLPIEPETATIYGNGGTGGNGGGGGAGASTVIIYDFATDKAGSVVQTASSKGPSGRSSGGNGGRGADGCILIFY